MDAETSFKAAVWVAKKALLGLLMEEGVGEPYDHEIVVANLPVDDLIPGEIGCASATYTLGNTVYIATVHPNALDCPSTAVGTR